MGTDGIFYLQPAGSELKYRECVSDEGRDGYIEWRRGRLARTLDRYLFVRRDICAPLLCERIVSNALHLHQGKSFHEVRCNYIGKDEAYTYCIS